MKSIEKLKKRGISTTEAMISSVLFVLILVAGLKALISVTNQQTAENNAVEAGVALESARAMLIDHAGGEDANGTTRFDLSNFHGDYHFCYEPGSGTQNFSFDKGSLPTDCKNRHFTINMNVSQIQVPANVRVVTGNIKWREGNHERERTLVFNMSKPRATNDGHRLKITVYDGFQNANGNPEIGVSGIQIITLDKNDQLIYAYTNSEGIAFVYGMRQDQPTTVSLLGTKRPDPHYYFRGPDIDPANTIWQGAVGHEWEVINPSSVNDDVVFNDLVPIGGSDPIGVIHMYPYGEIQGSVSYAFDDQGNPFGLLNDPDPFGDVFIYFQSFNLETSASNNSYTRTESDGSFQIYLAPGYYAIHVAGSVRRGIQDPDLRDNDTADAFEWPIQTYSSDRGNVSAQGIKIYDGYTAGGDERIRVQSGQVYDSNDGIHNSTHDHPNRFNVPAHKNTMNHHFNTHFNIYRKPHVTGQIFLATLNTTQGVYEPSGTKVADEYIALQYEQVQETSQRASYPNDIITTSPVVPPPDTNGDGQPDYNENQWDLIFPLDGFIGNYFYKINGHHRVGTQTDVDGNFRFANVAQPLIDVGYRSNISQPLSMFDQMNYFSIIPTSNINSDALNTSERGSPVLVLSQPNTNPPRQIYVLWLGENGSQNANYGTVDYWKDYVAMPSSLVFDTYNPANNHIIKTNNWTGLENWGRDNVFGSSPFVGDLYSYPIIKDLFFIGKDDKEIESTDIMVLPQSEFVTVTGNILNPDGTPWFYPPPNTGNTGFVRTVALVNRDQPSGYIKLGAAVGTQVGASQHTYSFNGTVLPSLPNYDHRVFDDATAPGGTSWVPFPARTSFSWIPNGDLSDPNNEPNPPAPGNWPQLDFFTQTIIDSDPDDPNDPTDPVNLDGANWHLMGNGNERYFFFSLVDDTSQSEFHTQLIKIIAYTKIPDPSQGSDDPVIQYFTEAELDSFNLEFEGTTRAGNPIGWSAGFIPDNSMGLANTNVVMARLTNDQQVPIENQFNGVSAPAFVPSTSLKTAEGLTGDQQIDIYVNQTSQTKVPIYIRSAPTVTNFFDVSAARSWRNRGTHSRHCPPTGCSSNYDLLRDDPRNPAGYFETGPNIVLAEMIQSPGFLIYARGSDNRYLLDFSVQISVKDDWDGARWNWRAITDVLTSVPTANASYIGEIDQRSNNFSYPLLAGPNIRFRFFEVPATDSTPALKAGNFDVEGIKDDDINIVYQSGLRWNPGGPCTIFYAYGKANTTTNEQGGGPNKL